jgi:hypothetical protein
VFAVLRTHCANFERRAAFFVLECCEFLDLFVFELAVLDLFALAVLDLFELAFLDLEFALTLFAFIFILPLFGGELFISTLSY